MPPLSYVSVNIGYSLRLISCAISLVPIEIESDSKLCLLYFMITDYVITVVWLKAFIKANVCGSNTSISIFFRLRTVQL